MMVQAGIANLDIQHIIMEGRFGKGQALEASCTREDICILTEAEQAEQQQTLRWGYLIKVPMSEPSIRPTTYGGIWRSLRFPNGKFGTDDWTAHGGRFQRSIRAECTWWLARDLFMGFCLGCVKLGELYVEANGVSRRTDK